MIERDSSLQVAEREIARGLLEGPEGDFFRGWGDRIVCADRGDAEAAVQEALANLGVCIGIKVTGGPVGGPGNFMEWEASVRIGEIVPTHRVEGWDGKAADVVLDAVLRAFAGGAPFRPKNVNSDTDADGNPIIEITGTTWVCTPGPEDGAPPPPELPEDDGPTAEDLEALG